jgi:hypothetical protein
MKTRLPFTVLYLICSALLFASPASTQISQVHPGQEKAKRGLLPTDLAAIKDVSDAQISPDGHRVAYVVSEVAPDRSRTISRVWVAPSSGGEQKRLIRAALVARRQVDSVLFQPRQEGRAVGRIRRWRRAEAGDLCRAHELLSDQGR